jgi:hypothetical protein
MDFYFVIMRLITRAEGGDEGALGRSEGTFSG